MLKTKKIGSAHSPVQIMIVTGEASGDEHAANLVDEIRQILPNCKFFGMGGARLRAKGVNTVVDSERVAGVMGFIEIRSKISELIKAFSTLVKEAEARQPALLILMDFPDFNFLLGKRLRRVIPRTIYFVAPQVWAWRSGRVKTMKRFVDKVAAIFPFEAKFYQERGMAAEYVGHPFLSKQISSAVDKEYFGLEQDKPMVALLPGSRSQEIDRLLTVMMDGFCLFREKYPDYQCLVPIAGSLSIADSTRICEEADKRNIKVVREKAQDVLANADIGLIASGTATMEAAAANLPFVSVYATSPVSCFIGKSLVRGVKNFTMANIIAGREIVPELLQKQVTAGKIAEHLTKIQSDEAYRGKMKRDLSEVISGLDSSKLNCFKEVAGMVYQTLKESGQLRKAGS